jgi:hypothetical protein
MMYLLLAATAFASVTVLAPGESISRLLLTARRLSSTQSTHLLLFPLHIKEPFATSHGTSALC